MPSNIFATTGTNVSILFIDATNKGDVILIDASNFGEKIKEGKNQKTVLRSDEERLIIETFNKKNAIEDFSVVVSYGDIEAKNFSLSAGQFFDIRIEHAEITKEEFSRKLNEFNSNLRDLFSKSEKLQQRIADNSRQLNHGNR